MINKQHHMIHYPLCIRMSGPLYHMSCMKYELKHNFSKRFAHIICNFKNISKSVANKLQLFQCNSWSADPNGLHAEFEFKGGDSMRVSDLPAAPLIEQRLGLRQDSEIFVPREVEINGTSYRSKLYVVTGVDESSDPIFGIISNILVGGVNNEIFFILEKCSTSGFCGHYHSFVVEKIRPTSYYIMQGNELLDHIPLSPHRSYEKGSPTYVPLRSCVLG